ncbi:MAG TPA: regulatory protein RecX [Puia sp.]|nr:regulatory protein RecX [Puia sp.]
MIKRKQLTREKALERARSYCRYQRRSRSEVNQKLYSFALRKKDVEELTAQLIAENYLNEEDFAVAFARGKFRMKQWGKVKITFELKLKKVSNAYISKALKEIDPDEYRQTLQKLAARKLTSLKNIENIFLQKRKLQDYLIQKGFENELVKIIVSAI